MSAYQVGQLIGVAFLALFIILAVRDVAKKRVDRDQPRS
jgi:hypothetical protein